MTNLPTAQIGPHAPKEKDHLLEVVTIADPKGRKIFDGLTDAEKDHVRRFGISRPGFDLALAETRMFDECPAPPPDNKFRRYDPPHWYQVGTIYAVGKLRPMPREAMQVVDIGSPTEQVLAVAAMDGITMTVVDVRPRGYPGVYPFQHIVGTATQLPIADDVVDVATSNCVMCHVGDGRYGDALDVDGDIKMLREVKRILKPGGIAVIGIGPMWHRAHLLFNWHRVYSEEWARKLFRWAGFKVQDFLVYDAEKGHWETPDLMDTTTKVVKTYYGFATLEKPVWTPGP